MVTEDPAWYPELNSIDGINRRQVMRTCPSTGRCRRCRLLVVVRGKRSTKYKVKVSNFVMRHKYQVRCWLRERGLPIFDDEDRIRREDGFNANFSVVDDPAASLEYEGMPPPEQPQQPKQQPPEEQQLKYAGEGDVGGGAMQQQRDERSGQVSEGVSAFWGIPGFSAWLRDLPDIDVDLNKLNYNTDPNDEVTSPPSLLPVVSDKRTCPSVELDLRRHFLVAATRYLMRVVGSANEQLKDCEAADQQMMQEIIGSNVRLVMEVQGYILQ